MSLKLRKRSRKKYSNKFKNNLQDKIHPILKSMTVSLCTPGLGKRGRGAGKNPQINEELIQ